MPENDPACLQRQLDVYRGLVEVSALINSITDSAELLPQILDVARRVMKAEAGSLFMVTRYGDLELVATSGAGQLAASERLLVPRGRGISGWVLENGEPLCVADAYADPRFFREADVKTGFRTRSILCVPLKRDEREIGVLQVLNPEGREAFDQADLEPFAAYGNLAATAIEKLRSLERRRDQERVQHEMNAARDIQESLLPHVLPRSEKFTCAAQYRPARNVGGDFYEVVESGADEIHFVIGDVSGKGMPAALLMAQALTTVRATIRPGRAPGEILARWNEQLSGRIVRGLFVTAIVGRVMPSTRTVEVACAGHCPPFLLEPGSAAVELKIPATLPLGILGKITPKPHTIALPENARLVFYTDGLTESLDAARQPLDSAGVIAMLAGAPGSPEEIAEALRKGEKAHRGEAEPHDDLTVLVLGCP